MEGKKQLSFSHRRKIPNLYIKEKIPLFRENIMKQNISKKIDILLDSQIEEKKTIIHNLFINKFGPNFFQKDNVIDEFKLMFGKYLLNTIDIKENNKDSNDIANKKKKTKTKEKELSTRINMGNMTYLDLRENIVSKKSLMNDKLFYLSKNLMVSNDEKDVLSKFLPSNKKKSKIYKNIKLQSNDKEIDKNFSENVVDNNKDIDNSDYIKPINYSLSQGDMLYPKKIINLKKYLMNYKKREERSIESFDSKNQQNYETEKKNNFLYKNPILLYNPNINTNYETKIENNSNSLLSNSQTNFFTPQISNYILPKYNNTLLESDKMKLKTMHLIKNSSDSDISNFLINNQCKSLSTNETNQEKIFNKNYLKRYNSLINFHSRKISKQFKTNFDSKANLLKNYIKKCNKRLVKLIDCNTGKKIQIDPIKGRKKLNNIALIKSLIDKKISNKVLKSYKGQKLKIKPILKMSQNDENKLSHDKKTEEKYFFKNYKTMKDNMALFFVGRLFNTKNIKFHLGDIRKQRKEIEKQKNKKILDRIRKKLFVNNLKIKKIKIFLKYENNKVMKK